MAERAYNGGRSNLPTGHVFDMRRHEASAHEQVPLFPEPPRNLEGFVRRPMSSRSSESDEFGPYRLDIHRRVLTRENQPVALPPKTLDLLLLLVPSQGRAFSKQETDGGAVARYLRGRG